MSAALPDASLLDPDSVLSYRLSRVRTLMDSEAVDALLLFDPVNIRYTNGSRNMQVWTMHNVCRYALVIDRGPSLMFEPNTSRHLLHSGTLIDEILPSLATDYMTVSYRVEEICQKLASSITAALSNYGISGKRLAVDRLDVGLYQALTRAGFSLQDGKAVMEQARAIKSIDEIALLKSSLETCEQAMVDLRESLEPGMTEQQALSRLIAGSVARGGEYPETRLMTSGPRTNPWFQETSDREIKAGDFLSFDTDLIGPGGFYNDISRSWIVGDRPPTDEQRRLYEISRQQLETNISLLQPGMDFLEFANKCFTLPDQYLSNRYADVGHGCGMAVEYPFLWYPEDAELGAYNGVFEENMVICIESYVGAEGGNEGVKLEQPVWISASGPVVLADYPLEDSYS